MINKLFCHLNSKLFYMITKKEVIQHLIIEVETLIPLPIKKRKIKSGSVTFEVENNCRIVFLFDTIMGGSQGKDSFVVAFSMSLHNPFFSNIKKEAFGIKDDDPDTKDLVLYLKYLKSLPKEWNVYERYLFSDNEDRYVTATRLLKDIKKYFIPYIKPFLRDYESLLRNYENPEFVKNIGNWYQFITGVIAALLTRQEDKIEEIIVPVAKKNTNDIEFMEFKNAKDYRSELVRPIKEYMKQKNII
jgi:hypothetical protein